MPKEREDDFQTDEFEDLNNDNKPIDEMLDPNGFTVIGIAEFLLRFLKD